MAYERGRYKGLEVEMVLSCVREACRMEPGKSGMAFQGYVTERLSQQVFPLATFQKKIRSSVEKCRNEERVICLAAKLFLAIKCEHMNTASDDKMACLALHIS
jgi:hypothetical protein